MVAIFKCEGDKHIGINNTTGRCPLCGEQLEQPSTCGFSKALWLNDKIEQKCMYDNFESNEILGLVCTCDKCSIR